MSVEPYRTKADIAATIASVVVASGHSDSRDLQAVAAAFGVPWQWVMGIVREQVGQPLDEPPVTSQ